jgi:glutamate synthase domain-containing protein 3
MMTIIDCQSLHYTPMNIAIREAVAKDEKEIVLANICGQRFIADGLCADPDVRIIVEGVPGGDLAMFMSGPTVIVRGNADHAPGNTMDSGTVVIMGSSGDATAHSMRGGTVFVRDNIGYRGGIHMKQYLDKRPVLVVGGDSGPFLGEYMAGGLIVVLRLTENGLQPYDKMGLGSGIHGGKIVIRGAVSEFAPAIGAVMNPATSIDMDDIVPLIIQYCEWFGGDADAICNDSFTVVTPFSARPFANKYVWE